MENLRALVEGRELTPYQRALAKAEFKKLTERLKYLEELQDVYRSMGQCVRKLGSIKTE